MKTWLPFALTGIVSFFVGFGLGLLAHFLTLRKDRQDRLRAFRNEISILVEKTKDAVPIDLTSIHYSSVKQIRNSCACIREDIRWWRKNKFDKLRVDYCGLTSQQIENKDPSCITDTLYSPTSQPPQKMKHLCDFERGRTMILELLAGLIDVAK